MDREIKMIAKILASERKKIHLFMSESRKIKGGSIKKRMKGNKYYYTEYFKGKEKGITKNEDRIQLLYRKKYLKSYIRKSKILIKHLESLMMELDRVQLDEECLYLGVYSREAYQWMREEYETNPMYRENLIYKTLLGTMVRSKSELTIANTLERLGIPYRYEQGMYVNGMMYYPDFVILLPDGNILIWEHNGLMDDEEYKSRSYIKIRNYETAGFRQHKNLIITYEDDIRTPEQIEEILQRFYIF